MPVDAVIAEYIVPFDLFQFVIISDQIYGGGYFGFFSLRPGRFNDIVNFGGVGEGFEFVGVNYRAATDCVILNSKFAYFKIHV